MFAKLFAGLLVTVALTGLSGANVSHVARPVQAQVDCCAAGDACCNPPSECCFSAKTVVKKDCCAAGDACCVSGEACCAASGK